MRNGSGSSSVSQGTGHGSVQSRYIPQLLHTILHCRSSIRSPQRSHVWTHSLTPGRAALGDGLGRGSMQLVHYTA